MSGRRKRFGGASAVRPTHLLINRNRSRGFRRIDRSGCLLSVHETIDRSNDRPLRTSIRLAYRVIAASKTSIVASAPERRVAHPAYEIVLPGEVLFEDPVSANNQIDDWNYMWR
jgi:hypothetical protein